MDIRTSQISFCNKKALNVVSDKFKSFLLSNLREQYNISITDRNAHILNRKSIINLSKNPHLISLKTIGNNYYLFLTRINEVNYCFFIDKKIKNGYTYPRVVSVKYCFQNDFFNDTIFEGELVRDYDNNWLFLIFDVRCYKGINQKNVNLVNKIQNIYSLFDNYTADKDIELCELQVKRFFNYSEFDDMMENFIPKLNYKIGGLFFNTLNMRHHNYLHFFPRKNTNGPRNRVIKNSFTGSSVNVSTHKNRSYHERKPSTASIKTSINTSIDTSLDTYFKTTTTPDSYVNKYQTKSTNLQKDNFSDKPQTSHSFKKFDDKDTMVFTIKKTDKPDVYLIYCIKNNDLVKYGVACIPTLKCSKFIRSAFINSSKDADVKVNCKYNSRFKKWQPMSVATVFFPDSFDNIKYLEESLENTD